MYGVGFGYGSAGATTILKSGGAAFDADAQAFFTASGVSDLTQKNAVNQLVLDLKSNSLWTKMKALYPVVGGNATAHSYNLVNTSLYTLSFSSGWTHSSTGMIPNGTSAYASTGLIPDNVGMTVNNNHLLIYSGTAAASSSATDYYDIGSGNNLGTVLSSIFTRRNNNQGAYDSGGAGTNRNTAYPTDGAGIFIGKVNSDLTSKFYRNGSLLSTKSITTQASLSPYQYYVGGFNELNTTTYYSQKKILTESFGLGLSDTDVANLTTIVNTFNTTLGRNTY